MQSYILVAVIQLYLLQYHLYMTNKKH